MQQENRMEQLSLDLSHGKTCPEPLAQEPQKARTSALSSKSLSELQITDYMFLDLRTGAGNLLGAFWEINSPSLGEWWTLNTGPVPHNAGDVSTLSQILQEIAPEKYYLSSRTCLGILRRASERGKTLPPQLEQALMIQAGVIDKLPGPAKVEAYHINQRNEGINLDGVSGALMATQHLQMQTFVTQNCAFAANQRDEVRDLHDVAGSLQAQPGIKQQTFVLNPWDTQQARISTPDGISPTLAGADGGGGRNPGGLVISLNDQGGQRMDISENIIGTLRAQMDGHPPLVMATQQGGAEIGIDLCPTITAYAGRSGNNQPVLFENHGLDSRCTGPFETAPTVVAAYGTGGNNQPLVIPEPDTYCIAGNIIDREIKNGGNGLGCQPNICYSLTTADRHAVYQNTVGALCKGDDKGTGNQYVSQDKCVIQECEHKLIRRLTPLECERLQGYPDNFTNIPGGSDAARYKALGNSVAIPCVTYVLQGIARFVELYYCSSEASI